MSRGAGSRTATTEATFTIAAPDTSLGATAAVRCRAARKFTRRTVSADAVPGTPATLARPERASGSDATAASMAAGSLRSHRRVSQAGDSRRSRPITVRPSAMSRSTVASPIPEAAPVTRTGT